MAAAIGAGLPINEPIGSMIVDIGGGTTEVAVISLGGIVVNHSIRVAGDEIDDAIIQYARRDHNLVIGERTAENAKIAAGSAYPLEEEIRTTLRGRDLLTGLPKSVEVSSVELRDAISQPVNTIVEVVKTAIEETPPSWSPTSWSRALPWPEAAPLFGLDRRLQTELKMPVYRADDPLTCVARGTGASPRRCTSTSGLWRAVRRSAARGKAQDTLSETAGAVTAWYRWLSRRSRGAPRNSGHHRPHEVRR